MESWDEKHERVRLSLEYLKLINESYEEERIERVKASIERDLGIGKPTAIKDMVVTVNVDASQIIEALKGRNEDEVKESVSKWFQSKCHDESTI